MPFDIALWRDRLDHAHEVWRDNGLGDESLNMNSVARYYAAYRGGYAGMWQAQGLGSWGGLPAEEMVTDPIYFEVINTLMAQMYARHPIVDVTTESGDRGSHRRANIQERLMNHVLRKRDLKIKRNVNLSLLDAVTGPFGIVRHGFTPTVEKITRDGKLIEYYDPAKAQFPWIRRWAPVHVRIDPMAERFDSNGDARWAAFRSYLTMDQVRINPGLIARQDLTPTHSSRDVSSSAYATSQTLRPPAQEDAELVEVWTIYDKTTREWFSISDGSASPLRTPKPWPIQWNSLPYEILIFNENPDSPFGTPYAQQLLPICIEVNKLLTLAQVAAKSTRRMIGVMDKAFRDDEEMKKVLNDPAFHEFFVLNGSLPMKDAVQQIQAGGVDQQLILMAEVMRQRARSAAGVSEMDRANRINVETAAEANQVGAGSSLQRGRNLGPFEDFVSDTVSTFGHGIQQTLDTSFAIPIVGQEDADDVFAGESGSPFQTVEPEQIQGEFVYSVRPGSTAPQDPMQEFKEELAINTALSSIEPLGQLVDWPAAAVALVKASGRSPMDRLTSNEQRAATQQDLQSRGLTAEGVPAGGGGPGGPGGPGGGGGLNPEFVKLATQGNA